MSVYSAKVIWVAGIAPKDLIHVDLGDAIQDFMQNLKQGMAMFLGNP